jgi:hypothetical protein
MASPQMAMPTNIPPMGSPMTMPTSIPTMGSPMAMPTMGGPVSMPTMGGPMSMPTMGGPIGMTNFMPSMGGSRGMPNVMPSIGSPMGGKMDMAMKPVMPMMPSIMPEINSPPFRFAPASSEPLQQQEQQKLFGKSLQEVPNVSRLNVESQLDKLVKLQGNCPSGEIRPIWSDVEIVETYCRCPSGTYGFDCSENFVNPCADNDQQYYPADPLVSHHYFIECSWNVPYLFKCPADLVWVQEITTCAWDDSVNDLPPVPSQSNTYASY